MNIRQPNRRRGRGNNNRAPQQNRGGGDYQNRIDNRARGNAAQMLEKYKKLANDAQLNGDRVQAEYYHQFADHYFRVLADAKARQDEQQAARQSRWQERRPSDEGDYGQEGGQDGGRDSGRDHSDREPSDGGSYDPYANAQRAQQSDSGDYSDGQSDGNSDSDYGSDEGERDMPRRQPREQQSRDQQSRGDRNDRNSNRNASRDRAPRERQQVDRRPKRDDRNESLGEFQGERTMFEDAPDEARAPRETKRPARRPRAERTDDAPATLDLAALPPAIGGGDEEPVKKPRAVRRPRKSEGETVEAAE